LKNNVTVSRACALKRFACLREAASAKAGRASVSRVRRLKQDQIRFDMDRVNGHGRELAVDVLNGL